MRLGYGLRGRQLKRLRYFAQPECPIVLPLPVHPDLSVSSLVARGTLLREKPVMSTVQNASNTTAPTQFQQKNNETYAYRRFGAGSGRPLLCLQHFTGTLDNWDPAVTDSLASGREVILFESAGLGRSTGKVPDTIAGMAKH